MHGRSRLRGHSRSISTWPAHLELHLWCSPGTHKRHRPSGDHRPGRMPDKADELVHILHSRALAKLALLFQRLSMILQSSPKGNLKSPKEVKNSTNSTETAAASVRGPQSWRVGTALRRGATWLAKGANRKGSAPTLLKANKLCE